MAPVLACSARLQRTSVASKSFSRNIRQTKLTTCQASKQTAIKSVGAAIVSTVLSVVLSSSAFAEDLPLVVPAAQLFTKNCAGCHVGGGNVIAASATLFTADLTKNGVGSKEALYDIIYKGKNKMPGYGTACAPKGACTFGKRLADEDVSSLSEYILERAAVAWVAE